MSALPPLPTSLLQKQTLVDSYRKKESTNQVFTVTELDLEETLVLCFKVGTCWFFLLNISWKHLLLSISISTSLPTISFSASSDFIISHLDFCHSCLNTSSAFTLAGHSFNVASSIIFWNYVYMSLCFSVPLLQAAQLQSLMQRHIIKREKAIWQTAKMLN